MKNNLIIVVTLFFLQAIVSCSTQDLVDCSASMKDIDTQLQNKTLLKTVTEENGKYTLTFEDHSIQLPSSVVQSITTDTALWKTELTLVNGTSYNIPTLGSSIDRFISSVKINPSTYNPLAAKVVLHLPVLGYMKVTVHSKPGKITPDVEYTYHSAETQQDLIVLGLYPNYDNQVTLTYLDMNGNERASSHVIMRTEALSHPKLPKSITVTKLNYAKMEPGMTLVNSPGESEADTSIPYMIDADGEIRWAIDWREHPILNHIAIRCGLTRMSNGHYLTGDGNHHYLLELNVLGEIVHKWDLQEMGYTFHHATSETSDGKILSNVSKVTAKLSHSTNPRVNDFIIKMDPKTGEVLKEWDLVQMLDSARYGLTDTGSQKIKFEQTASNWAHANGIIQIGSDYLATARYQGIFKFNDMGGVKWIISPHKGWRMKYRNILLTPLHKDGTPITDKDVIDGTKACSDFEWPWGVHDAVLLPNGHYMAFDNGYGRYFTMIPKEGLT